jgi:hypothetical protein
VSRLALILRTVALLVVTAVTGPAAGLVLTLAVATYLGELHAH